MRTERALVGKNGRACLIVSLKVYVLVLLMGRPPTPEEDSHEELEAGDEPDAEEEPKSNDRQTTGTLDPTCAMDWQHQPLPARSTPLIPPASLYQHYNPML